MRLALNAFSLSLSSLRHARPESSIQLNFNIICARNELKMIGNIIQQKF